MKRTLILSFIASTALSITAFGGYKGYQHAFASQPEEAEMQVQLPRVVADTPELRNITEWDNYAGRFVAVDEVNVRSRVTGYLDEVHFKDGDVVEKGDVLFTIDQRPFAAEVAMAEANLSESAAALNLAKANYARSSELIKTSAVSTQRLDQDRAQMQQAEAQLAAAESRLTQANLDLEFTTITAPITGRIDAHNVDVGNLVRGDDETVMPLTNIVSLDPIYIVFDVDQNAYLNYTKAAQDGTRPSSRDTANPVNIALQGDIGFPHAAKMDFVANRIDTNTGTIRARAVIDNADGQFTPGLFARVQLFSRADAETVLIPDSAIAFEQTDRVVFVVNAENRIETRKVQIGPMIDGKRVIRSGLSADERIVTRGLQRIFEGAEVIAESQAEYQTRFAQLN